MTQPVTAPYRWEYGEIVLIPLVLVVLFLYYIPDQFVKLFRMREISVAQTVAAIYLAAIVSHGARYFLIEIRSKRRHDQVFLLTEGTLHAVVCSAHWISYPLILGHVFSQAIVAIARQDEQYRSIYIELQKIFGPFIKGYSLGLLIFRSASFSPLRFRWILYHIAGVLAAIHLGLGQIVVFVEGERPRLPPSLSTSKLGAIYSLIIALRAWIVFVIVLMPLCHRIALALTQSIRDTYPLSNDKTSSQSPSPASAGIPRELSRDHQDPFPYELAIYGGPIIQDYRYAAFIISMCVAREVFKFRHDHEPEVRRMASLLMHIMVLGLYTTAMHYATRPISPGWTGILTTWSAETGSH